MSKRNMRIVFSSGISNLVERNSSFDSGVLRVAYTGRNQNNSFISKETFERCMPSIYNCPIVCRYDRETDTIGSHDMDLVASDDGSMRIVNITHPVGMIPESAKFWWEEIEDDSGLHEYLCVEALLWKRQEAYKKIKDDGVTDESMEISVKDGAMVDGVYVIQDFEFTAFCLLGSALPCFESASLEVFSCDSFKQELAEMMKEFKSACLTASFSLGGGVKQENSLKGGSGMEEKIALMNEFGLKKETLGFSLADFSLDELRTKFEAMKQAESDTQKKAPKNFALEGQFREELISALRSETIETCFGEMSRYCFCDYDNEAMEVYCYDTEDWRLYGFRYSMNGDNVVIDFDSKKRKKFAIVDFDEGEQPAAFAKVFEFVTAKFNENNAQWAEKYQTASDAIVSMENELSALRKFKADAENAAEKAERNQVFAQFGDLAGIEAFETLRQDCLKYSVEDLEEKCYAIRGRNGAQMKFSHEPKMPKLPVSRDVPRDDEPYGGLFQEYGKKSKRG